VGCAYQQKATDRVSPRCTIVLQDSVCMSEIERERERERARARERQNVHLRERARQRESQPTWRLQRASECGFRFQGSGSEVWG
jgi:hypothetical protein